MIFKIFGSEIRKVFSQIASAQTLCEKETGLNRSTLSNLSNEKDVPFGKDRVTDLLKWKRLSDDDRIGLLIAYLQDIRDEIGVVDKNVSVYRVNKVLEELLRRSDIDDEVLDAGVYLLKDSITDDTTKSFLLKFGETIKEKYRLLNDGI